VVNDGENAIISSTFGQAGNEVHCYLSEWQGVIWYHDFVQRSFRLVGEILVLLAGCAASHVLFDPLSPAWPVKVV
jgi:hypothetical protein